MPRKPSLRLDILLSIGCLLAAPLAGGCGSIGVSLPRPEDLSPFLEPADVRQAGFCEDWGPGLLFHEDERCFRQENCLYDCVQVCIDDDGATTDSRDTISPVIATAPNGLCLYDVPWDPVSGTSGHSAFWAHGLVDVVGGALGGD